MLHTLLYCLVLFRFLCVAVLVGWRQAGQLWRTKEPQWLQLSSLKVIRSVCLYHVIISFVCAQQVRQVKAGLKLDSRLTGSGHIDQELQKVWCLCCEEGMKVGTP